MSSSNVPAVQAKRSRFRMLIGLVLLLSVAATSRAQLQTPGYIYTFAGNGDPDQGANKVFYPDSLTFDAAGNLYACTGANNIVDVIKITPTGLISTFAGGGSNSPGDGQPATSARLRNCQGLAFDSSGNLYISDEFSVRIVSPNGIINTFAGTGTGGGALGDGGAATSANVFAPAGLAFDSVGNLYVAEQDSRIRKITPQGIISTFAGTGTYGYNCDSCSALSSELTYPKGLAFDHAGNLYVEDLLNYRIRKITPTGIITTFAGDGIEGSLGDGAAATAAEIDLAGDLQFDAVGNLYIGEYYGNRVRMVSPSGTITTFAGTGYGGQGQNYYNGDNIPATSARLSGPYGLAIDRNQNIYIADFYGQRIQEVISNLPPNVCNTPGNICTVAGNGTAAFSGDGSAATQASLNNPLGLFIDASNNIFVADSLNNRVRKFTVGGSIATVAGNGNGGPSVDDDGDGGSALLATTNYPGAVSEDGAGNLAILDEFANGNDFPIPNSDTYSTVRLVSLATGQISTFGGAVVGYFGTFSNDLFRGSYLNPSTNLTESGFFLPFYGANSLAFLGDSYQTTYQPNGYISSTDRFDLPTVSNYPSYLVQDSAGNIYFSSSNPLNYDRGLLPSYTVQMIDTSGNITTIAGNGNPTFSGEGGRPTNAGMTPGALAIDGAGNIFIVDLSASVVRVISAVDGNIYTIAGDTTQSSGYSGDGAPATSAQLNSPGGIKVDAAENLYISDTLNNRVRMVVTPTVPGCVTRPGHVCRFM